MSSYIDCVLDTEPMAEQIDGVAKHVMGTTAAVVGMKAAVIAAEQEAADHVCANVNRGFYTLIHSQITQKMAKLSSEVESHLLKLGSLSARLLAIKTRMEHDYALVAARYNALFNTLNKNLRTQISALDSPTFDLITKDAARMTLRTAALSATVPVAQTEALAASQRIIASNLKYQGSKAIDTMERFLGDANEQTRTTARILVDDAPAGQGNATLSVPVILCEYVCDNLDTKQCDIYLSNERLAPEATRRMAEAAKELLQNAPWKEQEASEEVKNELMRLLAEDKAPEKVKATARRLFAQHRYNTIWHVL